MRRALVIISTCCSHFADKMALLVAIGRSFATCGNNTTYLLSGWSPCAHIIRLGGDEVACLRESDRCFSELEHATSSLCRFQATVLNEENDRLTKTWAAIEQIPAEMRQFSGYKLSDICRSSLARRFQASPTVLGRYSDEPVVRHHIDCFQKDAIRSLLFFRRTMLDDRPDVVLHFSGRFHRDRCAMLVCQELRIPIVAIESSFHQRYVYWDESGRTGSSGRIGCPRPWRVPPGAIDCLETLMVESLNQCGLTRDSLLHYRSHSPARTHSKTLLFLAQVPYDAALVEDGADFSDQIEAVRAVSEHLSAIGPHRLIVRPHPKAPELADEITKLGLRNTSTDHSSTRGLLDDLQSADCAITVCSQSGLQAAWLGKPVVVLGRAFYSDKGFTFDAHGSEETLGQALADALTAVPADEVRRQACCEYLAYLHGNCMLRADTPSRGAELLESACGKRQQ